MQTEYFPQVTNHDFFFFDFFSNSYAQWKLSSVLLRHVFKLFKNKKVCYKTMRTKDFNPSV